MSLSRPRQFLRGAGKGFVAVGALFLLYSGNDQPTALEQVQQRGSLTVLTRNGASSYYLGADGPTGPEYELAQAFSEYLGVGLEIEVAGAFSDLSDMLSARRGELIAANLSRTRRRTTEFTFGPDYQQTEIVAVVRRDRPQPKSLSDLVGRKLMVLAGSSYEEALQDARSTIPKLKWEARADVGIEDLLLAVSDEAIDATLVDSNVFHINRSFYPRVDIAFALPGAVPHAWAFQAGADDSLAQKARSFFVQARANGTLGAILEHFYVEIERLNQFDMFHFLERVRDRLPALLGAFREAGEIYEIDWRLLAAVGYQESHWDPDAASRTGVRGIMMLTEQTAEQLGVSDRLDPYQSIEGGARYIRRLRDRLPDRIPAADRMWMALAAYNMGMGHLRDARRLTQKLGKDPDSWADVRQSLDLLSQEKWFSETRHGYARGFEAKQFVANIRRYFDILTWMETREHPLLITQVDTDGSGSPATPADSRGRAPDRLNSGFEIEPQARP